MSGKKSKTTKSKTTKKKPAKSTKSTRDAMNVVDTSAEIAENMVLPEAHAVMVAKREAAEQGDMPAGMSQKPMDQKSPAEWAYERIIMYIQNFEKQLDGEHEVAMGFTAGDVGRMRIEGMGFFAPDVITFYGADEAGGKTQLVQHVSQLNVMLRAMPKPDNQKEAQRIGFKLGEGLKKAT